MDYRTEDYEKSFLEKYLERTANSKICEISKRIERCRERGDLEGVCVLEQEIERIKEELAADKSIVVEERLERREVESKEMIDFGWDASDDDTDFDSFSVKYRKARTEYCRHWKMSEDAFEEEVRRGVTCDRFTVPGFLWDHLFSYQREGVEWLLRLYRDGKGGVLADDMGLGKTVQVVVFLVALFNGGFVNRVLILCPATVIAQWLHEWKRFYPFIRIFCKQGVSECGGVYLMSYEKFKARGGGNGWDILILDEGHRIKNKEAQVTLSVKRLRSEYKFVLSGTPIQNNLGELWSIFDFVNPGLLGSYTSFYEEFEDVISRGGYKNASGVQVERSYKQSMMLRSLIEPYILRRSKTQVSHKLPSKVDRVIFCPLTPAQIQHYNRILGSRHIANVLSGKANFLSGISILRKVCNHPRLLLPKGSRHGSDGYGVYGGDDMIMGHPSEFVDGSYDLIESSCKIKILLDFLERWKLERSKVLIFSQTIEMLDIIEECIGGYKYLRMDGTTSVSLRPELISRFNGSEDIFIFLLTTRVGGLGLNLTGASRIVIYDPDWNPSTDTQAKERAWRYGQKKDVEIYRFVCKETIEEKIYQKQIFKDLLGKKVLSNPKLSRFFNKSCMDELFSATFATNDAEIKIHETHQQNSEDKGPLKDVRNEDYGSFSRMKYLNEKRVLSGREVLEYIRLREKP